MKAVKTDRIVHIEKVTRPDDLLGILGLKINITGITITWKIPIRNWLRVYVNPILFIIIE